MITHCLQMFKCARWCSQQKLENCTQLFFGLTLFRSKSLHQIDGCRQPAPLNSIPHTNGLDNVMQLCFFCVSDWNVDRLYLILNQDFSHNRNQTVASFFIILSEQGVVLDVSLALLWYARCQIIFPWVLIGFVATGFLPLWWHKFGC